MIFLYEGSQGDHIKLLYEFEMCTKSFGCVGSCEYVPPSVKTCKGHDTVVSLSAGSDKSASRGLIVKTELDCLYFQKVFLFQNSG